MTNSIEKAADAIRHADNILITAGAGMGVDSGLPDFRGNQGFWRVYPALKGYPFEEMANPRWFHMDPSRAWGFYGHRLHLYRRTIPHEGFQILKSWLNNRDHFIFTSNVDGAFQTAGFSDERISECHGSIHHVQYVRPNVEDEIWSASGIEVSVDEENCRAEEPLPRRNNRLLRPNILMFGDDGWISSRTRQQGSRLNNWLDEIELSATVIVEMGAGTAVPTVRYFGEQLQSLGARLIRINPKVPQGPPGTISISEGAKNALLAIDDCLN